jgi:hypothetical protein
MASVDGGGQGWEAVAMWQARRTFVQNETSSTRLKSGSGA